MTDAAFEAEAAAPAPKADPETLVLRARPRPVVRFRRGVIIGAALLGSTAVAGIAWLGLKPIPFTPGVTTESSADPQPRNADDTLGKAPKGYGDIPRLGPPLPGDLGKPILDHQRSLGEPMPPIDPNMAQATQAIEMERQRATAERKAAREAASWSKPAMPRQRDQPRQPLHSRRLRLPRRHPPPTPMARAANAPFSSAERMTKSSIPAAFRRRRRRPC
jgi:type IV secretory pathway VirB10-like protein